MKNVFFSVEGSSQLPAIVLGHPLGMNSKVWDEVLPELAKKFRIIRWDLPGHGLSAPLDPSSPSLKTNDLVETLIAKCDEFDIKTFHYIGTSIGGVIGQQLLVHYPERLLSATLTNTGAKIGTTEAWLDRQQAVMKQGLGIMSPNLVLRWFSENSQQQNPTLINTWQQQLAKVDDYSYGALCAWLGQTDLNRTLTPSDVPVQLICGSHDVATTPALMDQLASLLQVDNLDIIDNVGHVPSVEAPEQLLSVLKCLDSSD